MGQALIRVSHKTKDSIVFPSCSNLGIITIENEKALKD